MQQSKSILTGRAQGSTLKNIVLNCQDRLLKIGRTRIKTKIFYIILHSSFHVLSLQMRTDFFKESEPLTFERKSRRRPQDRQDDLH